MGGGGRALGGRIRIRLRVDCGGDATVQPARLHADAPVNAPFSQMLASTGVKTGGAETTGTVVTDDAVPDDIVESVLDAGWHHRGPPAHNYSVHFGESSVSCGDCCVNKHISRQH